MGNSDNQVLWREKEAQQWRRRRRREEMCYGRSNYLTFDILNVSTVILVFYVIFLINSPTCVHAKPSFCMKAPAVSKGECNDNLQKYFYLEKEDTCKLFNWGGCMHNRNVFEHFETCMKTCGSNATYLEEDYEDSLEATTTSPTTWPSEEEDEENFNLKLEGNRNSTIFTFASPSSYILMRHEEISRYQIRNRRSISLEFRTRQPHALLAYHGISNKPSELNKYELYIMLEQGRVKVKHQFGDASTTLVVGKGLNRDHWHKIKVTIDPGNTKIIASVDDGKDSTAQVLEGLRDNYLYGADNVELQSVIFIGGLSNIVEGVDISYLAKTFIGCVRNVSLESSPLRTGPLEPIQPLLASQWDEIKEKCFSKCWEPTVKCSRDSKCINYYDHVECDCFKARFKGEKCKEPETPTLTLFGYSYLTFTVFEWMDRVHSDENRISMEFKTQLDDSILFYASGETPKHNHVALSIINGSVWVDIDFGNDGEDRISKLLKGRVTDSNMHILTIIHQGRNVTIKLDGEEEKRQLTGPNIHLHINPDIYIGGGGPSLKNRRGLMSSNNFVGCVKEVYFNTKAILHELQQNNLQAHHHGLTAPAFGQCSDQKTIPITIPFAASGFKIWNEADNPADELLLKFAFKSNELYGTLAYSDIRSLKGEGFWELKFGVDELIFELQQDKSIVDISQPSNLTVKYKKGKGMWHSVELSYKNGEIRLTTGTTSQSQVFPELFQLSPFITIGTSAYQPGSGFKGCIRRIEIGDKLLDSRHIVGSDEQIGDIALDNCQFIHPCHRPDVCEHGGKCQVENDKVTCDCANTGYTGKRCHFATYKRTCEELALLGYTKSGEYKIDIDGNGPYRPSDVKCKFENSPSGETKTIVEHNLTNETDVWSPDDTDKSDFKLKLTYRQFSSEMLLSLISQSVQCSQYIKYDCYKTRLGLFQYTWFKSADPKENRVVSIGDALRGSCPCSLPGAAAPCAKGHHCNCDSTEDRWLDDEGYFTNPERLGITEMSFVVPKNLAADANSRITLGPLECVEANTQRYVVTFKTFGSYLEAPGWKSGDLAFSFRTTRSSAILLYQPLLHEMQSAFSVFLTNEYELTFQFVLSGSTIQNVTVRSEQRLSNGEWQQVWIDFDLHEVRFQINAGSEMITLSDGEQFGPFEGTMYIAGAPENVLEKAEVKEGLIGCFRGLVMNGQVLDLYSYMKFHKADIIKDCSPSCDPNPCQNEAYCQENWGSFLCQCSNPFAHSGSLCERDINVDGLTFLSQSSYIKRQSLDSQPDPIKNILASNIYLNIRTYDSEALVLYANDNLNNFVQLHIEDDTMVVFTWNEKDRIRRIKLKQKRLNHGISVQIAVTRNATHTVLHVNENQASKPFAVNLLTSYSEKPWVNPELEIFTPPRPFAPISPYYQLLLGGFDNYALKPAGNVTNYFPGMLGCLQGLQVGSEHIKISDMANNEDVLEGCKMVCDGTPCHHGGVCLEDFTKRNYTCDCTFTSYYGVHCEEERVATFQGESYVRRRFTNTMKEVQTIEARFGFTTVATGKDTILMTIQIPSQAYSLLFSMTGKGKLIVREAVGSSVEGATIKGNYGDGRRHSVYFKRTPEETIYIVDQDEIPVTAYSAEFSFFNQLGGGAGKENGNYIGEVYVGGVGDSVGKLKHFQRFRGCFANIFVKVNGLEEIRPMDEYMGFVKKPEDLVLDVEKVEGIKLGQACESMEGALLSRGLLGMADPLLIPTDPTGWKPGLPQREKIFIRKIDAPNQAALSFDTLALVTAVFFVILIIFISMYVYKINKRYRLRKLYEDEEDDLYFTHRGQPAHYYGPTSTELKYMAYRKTNPDGVALLNNTVGANNHANGHYHDAPMTKNDLSEEDRPPRYIEEEEEEIDDDDEEDETTSQNESSSGAAVSDQNEDDINEEEEEEDEAIDEKDDKPGENESGVKGESRNLSLEGISLSPSTSQSSKPSLPSSQQEQNNDIIKPPSPIRTAGAISPVFLNENARTFEKSPIAIIGGQRYQQMKRASKDSILSLD